MKISIIIPTRERAMYLGASIRTALNIEDDNIEVIVADNASTDNTREVVEAETDPRLVYLPSERRMSMRENFNRSLNASSGDYVIFIGDDDSIVVEVRDKGRWARQSCPERALLPLFGVGQELLNRVPSGLGSFRQFLVGRRRHGIAETVEKSTHPS